jgi:hypothetical protein
MKALPVEPLLEASKLPVREFLRVVGCPYNRMQRKLAEGLTVDQADTWAVRLGMHPIEAYGVETWVAALAGECA